MNVTDTAEIIAMIRDIAFLVLLLMAMMGMLAVFILYRKLASMIDSARRTVKQAEDIFSAVSNKVVKPATAGSGAAFGAGKLASFLLGLRRKRRERGGSDG